jgi:hypothetical protein
VSGAALNETLAIKGREAQPAVLFIPNQAGSLLPAPRLPDRLRRGADASLSESRPIKAWATAAGTPPYEAES